MPDQANYCSVHGSEYAADCAECQNAREEIDKATGQILYREVAVPADAVEDEFLCIVDGCDRAKEGNGYKTQRGLLEHFRDSHPKAGA